MTRIQSSNLDIRVVVIGGGTGNATVLGGLSRYVGSKLTAVVNTFDDGGASGDLRAYFDDLPAVGDLRQCLEALSRAPEDERALFNARFSAGNEEGGVRLQGQTLGNLTIAIAMQEHGNFSSALEVVSRMWNIKGRVLAASEDNRRLQFHLPDGMVIYGEHKAEETPVPSMMGVDIAFDKEPTVISGATRAAIEAADIVVLAPGDLYTSMAPVLAVGGMKEALLKAGEVIMVANLMNRDRHTVGFTVLDYAREYERIIGMGQDERLIDRIIFNTELPDKTALDSQAKLGSHPVVASKKMLQDAGYKAVGKDLLSHEVVVISPHDAIAASRSTIRHDSDKTARCILREYFA